MTLTETIPAIKHKIANSIPITNNNKIMAIKSTKKTEDIERVIAPKEKEADQQNDVKLRPKKIEDYVGQDSIKKHLKISIGSAQIRNEPLEHVLLY
jgi:hypothetical protein